MGKPQPQSHSQTQAPAAAAQGAKRSEVFGHIKEPSAAGDSKAPESQEWVESRPPAEPPVFAFKFPGLAQPEGDEKKQETVPKFTFQFAAKPASEQPPAPLNFNFSFAAPTGPKAAKTEPAPLPEVNLAPSVPSGPLAVKPAAEAAGKSAEKAPEPANGGVAAADKDRVNEEGVTIVGQAEAKFDPVAAGEDGEKNLFKAEGVTYYIFDTEGKTWVKNYVGFIRVNRPLTEDELEGKEAAPSSQPRVIFRRNGTFLLCINSALAPGMAVKRPEGNSRMLEAMLVNVAASAQEGDQKPAPALYLFKFQTPEERDKCYEVIREVVGGQEK